VQHHSQLRSATDRWDAPQTDALHHSQQHNTTAIRTLLHNTSAKRDNSPILESDRQLTIPRAASPALTLYNVPHNVPPQQHTIM